MVDNLDLDYAEACGLWIEHDEIREEVLAMVKWWVDRDDRLRNKVAELAGEVYRRNDVV